MPGRHRIARPVHWLALSAGLLLASPVSASGPDKNLPDLVATLLPGVVNITTIRYSAHPAASGQTGETAGVSYKSRWYGSGFIISPDGYAVTNKHVVHNGINFWVTLSDGRWLPAKLIREATGFDIAVIKILADKPLPTVKLGDSSAMRQGDFVIAIGNPLNHQSTVSTGIISALNRDMHFTPFDDYMQTDAAINEGNSGGPLFNARGEVIAVNSAIYTTGVDTGNIGIGFAIPINDTRFVVAHLEDRGLKLAYMGVQLQSISPQLAVAYGLPGPWGAIVVRVPDGTPAADAGLHAGDIITRFEDREVTDSRALMRDIVTSAPGATVSLRVLRGGVPQDIAVTLTELPPNQSYGTFLDDPGVAKPDIPADALVNFGLELASMTAELREKYHLGTQEQGVVITGVVSGSAAADASISPGSLILRMRDTQVASPAQVVKAVADERTGRHSFVPMLLAMPSGLRWMSLPLD